MADFRNARGRRAYDRWASPRLRNTVRRCRSRFRSVGIGIGYDHPAGLIARREERGRPEGPIAVA